LSDVSFIPSNILLQQIRRDCARAGFSSATPEVIGAPSFEIGWSGPRSRLAYSAVRLRMMRERSRFLDELCLGILIEFRQRAYPIFSKAVAKLSE
jgi:hypothetical protein